MMEVFNYWTVSAFQIPDSWKETILEKCPPSNMWFFAKYWSESGIAQVFGMYYGLLLQSVYWDGISRYSRPERLYALKGILRFAVLFIVAFPLRYLKDIEVEGVFTKRVVNNILPYFLIFFYVYGLCDAICACFKLYKVKTERKSVEVDDLIYDHEQILQNEPRLRKINESGNDIF